jgi:hypothetical protein
MWEAGSGSPSGGKDRVGLFGWVAFTRHGIATYMRRHPCDMNFYM